MASYYTLQSSSHCVRCSLDEGEDVALHAALEELGLDVRQEPPVVECWLPLRDVRLMRGMAGAEVMNGHVDSRQVEQCAAKARVAATDVAAGWAGSRIWGGISEIALDGHTLSMPDSASAITGNRLRVEVLEAFYHPEVEQDRLKCLRTCGLAAPTYLHLSSLGHVEAFTTPKEQHEGIAVVRVGDIGAEIAVCIRGNIAALMDTAAPPADPSIQLIQASAWLEQNGWKRHILPHGIRVLGRGLDRKWLDPIQMQMPFPVTLHDDPVVGLSLTHALFRNSSSQTT